MEKEAGALSQKIHVLSNEKFILQQETEWGRLPINEMAGVLNWPEILNDVDRSNGFSDLVRILGLFSNAASVADNPSACWDALATKNYDQLLTFGYSNFKRTIGNNYFNFLVQKSDPQIRAAEVLLAPEVVENCRLAAGSIPEVHGFPCPDQFSYNYFVLLLWEYAKKIDTRRHLETLKEPEEGNPILIPHEGRNISQDLANSLIEYYAISESVPFERIDTVLEIGGGYGRDAYVILSLNPNVRVVMVDITPALYIAQRYLSSVFKERRVFRAREFARYEDVGEELEAASIVFLMPHQLALMPEKYFDLSMNISSFGEMGKEQIDWYFWQLGRVTKRHFYMKQWRTSNNIFDGVQLEESDYPCPANWRKLYSRPCSVQSEFFEALYKVSKS
ncbi:MAG: putative sugar O-methyltransferase [Gallionella sp.]|nr:MAG: putative sugar O-methyltransferase [Gallionella sp.]